ncbi:NADP-dependent oxidoreductase [Nocardia callitridis]|uniref:NADP-dependent oxidoreductase n=1 Tax=Nocardia callitridis TaxID=648753 RepID=A0ABP9KEW1_9NOCA
MPRTNRQWSLARTPRGRLTTDDLALVESPIPQIGPNEILVRNTWLSIDPSIRIRLSSTTPLGYLPPIRPGEPLVGLALGTVIDTRNPDFAVGDLVSHIFGFRDYAVIGTRADTIGGYGLPTRIDTRGMPPQWYLGPLGSSGLTAYAALTEVLQLRQEDTVWVSAAAGGVGAIAAQIAKLRGATVLGSAGRADKVEFLRQELGIAAFDYHDPTLHESLAELAPDGIDAYFDNVGGDHLAAAMDNLRPRGRIAVCGAVSGYDGAPHSGNPDLFQIVSKELRIQGFRAGSYNHLEGSMRQEVGGYLTAGDMVYHETIFDDLTQAPTALLAMLAGKTIGKTLCRLTSE